MTVLSDNDIREELENGDLEVDRGDKELAIEPASMDLHLGRKIKYPAKRDDKPVSVDDEDTYPEYATVDTPRPLVRSGAFALAHAEESIKIPKGKVGILHGRSSVGRLGLFIENAGFVDPGFGKAQLTLELYNSSKYDIELKSGMRIGQLSFHDLKNDPDITYSQENNNKYSKQMGATESKLYEDFE